MGTVCLRDGDWAVVGLSQEVLYAFPIHHTCALARVQLGAGKEIITMTRQFLRDDFVASS